MIKPPSLPTSPKPKSHHCLAVQYELFGIVELLMIVIHLVPEKMATVFEKDSSYILFIHRTTSHYTLHESKEEIF
jgi:hypothetical protein